MFSESLEAIVTQTLCKKKGGGRMAACEILVGVPAVRNLIREGKIHQIPSSMQTGQRLGMQTLDMALQDLVARGLITREEAAMKSSNSALFGAVPTGTVLAGTKLAAA
jgi:twitching motility protein PilT